MTRAYQIQRPATAFTLSTGKKRPRKESVDHLKFIRGLPCLVTGKRPADAAHIRYADPRYGKRETGKSEKPHDMFTVPLHRSEHDAQHKQNEVEYWQSKNIDPIQVALALFGASGDDEAAEMIIREARARMK